MKINRTIELSVRQDGKNTIEMTFVEWHWQKRREVESVILKDAERLPSWLVEWVSSGTVPTEAKTI